MHVKLRYATSRGTVGPKKKGDSVREKREGVRGEETRKQCKKKHGKHGTESEGHV
jgi:hypothetical protein